MTDVEKSEFYHAHICAHNTISHFLQFTLFCFDLRAFVWRQIEPKIVSVEKNDKYQVCLSVKQHSMVI